MWFSFLIYITDMSYFVVYSIKMIDSSDYTVEYRVHAASFFIASEQTRHAMKLVRDRLRVQFDIEPPEHRIIKVILTCHTSKNPRITLEYQVRWIACSFIFGIFLHISDFNCCLVGLPPLGLSNKLPVSNNLVLQALIMRCSGGSISNCTRSLSRTSFMACLVCSLAIKNEAA